MPHVAGHGRSRRQGRGPSRSQQRISKPKPLVSKPSRSQQRISKPKPSNRQPNINQSNTPKPLVPKLKPSAPPGEKGGGGTDSGNKTLTASLLSKKIQNDTVKTKSTNPIKKWVYKGDTKGSQYYKDLSWKKGKELLKDEKGFGGKWGYKWSHPANIGKSNFSKLTGFLKYPGTGGTPAERYLYEQGAKTFGKAGKFVGSRANIAVATGLAAYDTTNWLMNNTSAGQNIKDKLKKFGYNLGDVIYNAGQKLKDFSLISSANAGEINIGEIDIYAPGKGPDAGRPTSREKKVKPLPSQNKINISPINEVYVEIVNNENIKIQPEIKNNILDSINSIAENSLSPISYKIVSTSLAIANVGLIKKEFKINLNESSNIVTKWKDGVSLMYNLEY